MKDADLGALTQGIAALRQRGADKFDPVGFFHLETLARRTLSHQGPVKQILGNKLDHALVRLRDDFEQALTESQQAVDQVVAQHPQAAAELQQLHGLGDFAAVKSGIARLRNNAQSTPLSALAGQLSHQRLQGGTDGLGKIGSAEIGPDLKATQYFRKTWAKLSVDKRVTQALGQAPKNAGPINSHMLVLRSLALMRELSPDYLHRLTAYVDTLLCLDQWDQQKQATAKKPTGAVPGKRIRSRPANRKA